MADFGLFTLLPPVLAITFAMFTKRVYESLTLGILVAGVMVAGDRAFSGGDTNAIAGGAAALGGGFMQSVQWMVLGVADTGHAGVIAFTLFLGGLVAVMQRSGAIKGFGEAALRFASTRRRGQGLAWFVGAAFLAIDDYFHVIAAGTIFRPVTDKLKVSREKLAYVIDSTAAPMVILVPISTWVGFILSVVAPVLVAFGDERTAFAVFIEGLPYNFYAILTVAFVGFVTLLGLDFGPMAKAERRAMQEGKLLRDGAQPLMSRELAEMEPEEGAPPRAFNLVLPVLFLFVAAISMLYATGYAAGVDGQDDFVGALQNASAELSLAIASFLALGFAWVLYRSQGLLKGDGFLDTVLDGFKAMVPALAILGLAWGIGNAVGPQGGDGGGIGLGDYLADTIGDSIDAAYLPLLAFLFGAVIAFATGTSFGTFTIMIPVTLGLAAASGDASMWFGPVLAATLGGAVFGDHCSPISDTTVMSSMAGHCDHIDHVKTQLPYALTMAAAACLGYLGLAWSESLSVAWLFNGAAFAVAVLVGLLASRNIRRINA
ncbi:MAG: Na+/H+ antiporter NhaC family protein [Thermoplasmatota archaeon]